MNPRLETRVSFRRLRYALCSMFTRLGSRLQSRHGKVEGYPHTASNTSNIFYKDSRYKYDYQKLRFYSIFRLNVCLSTKKLHDFSPTNNFNNFFKRS